MAVEQKRRILVADDEPELLRLLVRALASQGYTAVGASNGREATEAWLAAPDGFDVVVLDMRMPVMSGYEAYRALRERSPQARFVLISGYPEGDLWQSLRGEPCVRCLHKPFRTAELLAAVRDLLALPTGPAAAGINHAATGA